MVEAAKKEDAKRILGVFSVPSYTTVGKTAGEAPYDPMSVLSKEEREKRKNTRWLGKQLSTTVLKHGKTVDVYFDYDKAAMEKHKWLANPFARGTDKPIGSYADTQPMVYRISQPRDARTLGFMSKDANRRDEFTNVVRSQQLLQTIDREAHIAKQGQDAIDKQAGDQGELPPVSSEMEEDQGTFKYAGPQYVFDIGRSADTAFCMKCGKEQFYCPHIKQQSHGQYAEKRLGPARNYLSSIAVGSGANQLSGEGTVFARRPLIKDTFYRQVGVFHKNNTNPFS